jgi:hypothetical protein
METLTADKMLVQMHNDLKRYAQGKNANPKIVQMKEQFIDRWQKIVSDYESQCEMLQDDCERSIRQLTKLKNTIIKLEAICFIHGINDLPAWMAKDIGALVDDVRFNQKFDITQIPDRLLENEAWREFHKKHSSQTI